MERRGRDEVDVIARETSNETGKTEEEVRRYHKVFWERHKELADWERVIDKIEKGEKRLQRSKEIREALAEKIARFADCVEIKLQAPHAPRIASAHWLISTQIFVEHDAHLWIWQLGAHPRRDPQRLAIQLRLVFQVEKRVGAGPPGGFAHQVSREGEF